MAVNVLCLFLAVPWVGLWSVMVTFPCHTHLLLRYVIEHMLEFLKYGVFCHSLIEGNSVYPGEIVGNATFSSASALFAKYHF